MKTTKPRRKKEEEFRIACKKYVEGRASLDYLLHYIIVERLIKK